jgi:D-alanyl-D-alanine dipeptidase
MLRCVLGACGLGLLAACAGHAPERTPPPEALEWRDLHALKGGFAFDLRYGTPDNFTKEVLYPRPRALLRRSPAEALAAVQADLRRQGLGLKIWDAYRPLPVQQKMWDLIRDERYVSNPAVNKGRHTRGTSVDVTLVDAEGRELPMPTAYDDFSEKAHSRYEGPGLTPDQRRNRALLRKAMEAHGFTVLPTEWWHFDYRGWSSYPPEAREFRDLLKEGG